MEDRRMRLIKVRKAICDLKIKFIKFIKENMHIVVFEMNVVQLLES